MKSVAVKFRRGSTHVEVLMELLEHINPLSPNLSEYLLALLGPWLGRIQIMCVCALRVCACMDVSLCMRQRDGLCMCMYAGIAGSTSKACVRGRRGWQWQRDVPNS